MGVCWDLFLRAARTLALAALLAGGGEGAEAAERPGWGPLELVSRVIAPGERKKFSFATDQSFEASYLDTPVFAARGVREGVTLCVTAGVHGDEINGVEVARRVFAQSDPKHLAGTLIVVPAINADGFRTGSRYLPDRRDLNRAFPGRPDGSLASLIADAVFSRIVSKCDALVDLHTASNRRSNLPQVRVDLQHREAAALAVHFGVGYIVHGAGPKKSLRREAVDAGIPAILYEAGEPLRFQPEEIERGVQGVRNVMAYLGLLERPEREIPESRIYRHTSWIRAGAREAGFFFPDRALGARVAKGQLLGEIVDPLTDERHQILATREGDIIGMAVPQPILSGNALFHIGLR